MKFAKELEENAIPEWKDKYFDYKGAKKKLKAVGRAARNVDRSSPLARRSPFGNTSSLRDAPVYSFLTQPARRRKDLDGQDDNQQRPLRTDVAPQWQRAHTDDHNRTPRARPMSTANERSPLRSEEQSDGAPKLARYGSIIGSPPSGNSPMPDISRQQTQASLLELPDPALQPSRSNPEQARVRGANDGANDAAGSPTSPEILQQELRHPDATRRQFAHVGNAYEITNPTDAPHSNPPPSSLFLPKRSSSFPDNVRPPFVQRVFSLGGGVTAMPSRGRNDVALEAYREIDFRQAEFFLFLDVQLDKIEGFYKTKEDEATERLGVLREQLHVLRNRRLEEIVASEEREQRHYNRHHGNGSIAITFDPTVAPDNQDQNDNGDSAPNGTLSPEITSNHNHRWASVTSQVEQTLDKVRTGHVGKTSRAMEELGTPPSNQFRLNASNLDYTRRKPKEVVPAYRAAKRKLKAALVEFYRGLELLKSYTLLNRTAFRKINKKFDKTANVPAGGTMRYMTEKVNKAHFVNSDVIDSHLQTIEDLYARYFERGNRKVAIGKLRGKTLRLGDYTGALCRTGFFLGSGIVLGVQGLVYGIFDLYDPDSTTDLYTSYLLQIYAGYFLFLLLVGLFCIDARVFSRAKVNYQFVFEFDTRHTLDWRQLSEIPAVFFFLLALTMFINFASGVGGGKMFIFWPVVLIGVSLIFMFLPPPFFYWNARRWFLYSLWRLFWAGLYPVEFRDFFLGDMFCSQAYALGNMELFFCFYARYQTPDNLPMCSSSNSRLLGFFSALPGIWRALQCIRRYIDTRNFFPHLVNCGKYMFTILQYMTLSLVRINKTAELKALFIVCASINTIYCSIWDLLMDWSLLGLDSKHWLLRDTIAYRRQKWFYYVAMVLDPILRCNWILYAIFIDEVQHSSVISFSVAISEVLRRGMWTLIRVENEHCTNVSRNRAARDVELPYQRTSPELLSTEAFDGTGVAENAPSNIAQESEDVENMPQESADGSLRRIATGRSTGTAQAGTPSSASFLRQRKQAADSPVSLALKRVGSTIAMAHSQDYERKRRPVYETHEERESEDEDEDEEEIAEAERRREEGGRER